MSSETTSSSSQVLDDATSFSEQSKYHAVAAATGIGFATIIFVGIWQTILGGIYYVATGGAPPQVNMLLGGVTLIPATASVLWLYFRYTDSTRTFLDIKKPSPKAVGIAILATGVLFVAAVGLEQFFQLFGITASEHQVVELATADQNRSPPTFLLAMIPVAILIIGPAEELVYRGLIQKSLYSKFTANQAIVLASTIFALVHFPAYLTSSIGGASFNIASVFILSMVLGKTYATTENLVIPSLTHGLYNAVQFGLLYIEVTNAI